MKEAFEEGEVEDHVVSARLLSCLFDSDLSENIQVTVLERIGNSFHIFRHIELLSPRLLKLLCYSSTETISLCCLRFCSRHSVCRSESD